MMDGLKRGQNEMSYDRPVMVLAHDRAHDVACGGHAIRLVCRSIVLIARDARDIPSPVHAALHLRGCI